MESSSFITVAIVAICSIVGIYYTLVRRREPAEKPIRVN